MVVVVREQLPEKRVAGGVRLAANFATFKLIPPQKLVQQAIVYGFH